MPRWRLSRRWRFEIGVEDGTAGTYGIQRRARQRGIPYIERGAFTGQYTLVDLLLVASDMSLILLLVFREIVSLSFVVVVISDFELQLETDVAFG